MNDKDLAQLRADLEDKLREIREKTDEAAEIAARINAEEDRRKELPGTVLPFARPDDEAGDFRPRPGGTPEDGE